MFYNLFMEIVQGNPFFQEDRVRQNMEPNFIPTIVSEDILQQYKSAIDQSTIISKTDVLGRITYANDEFCRISGFNRDELIGRPHNVVRHPDMPKITFQNLWKTVKSGQAWKGVVQNRRKDGTSYWVQTSVFPIVGPGGKIVEYISVRSDITQFVQTKDQFDTLVGVTKTLMPDFAMAEILDQYEKQISDPNHRTEKGNLAFTALFCDLQSLEIVTEEENTESVLHLLEALCLNFIPIVQRYHGNVSSCWSESFLATFRCPIDALEAAQEIHRTIRAFNKTRIQKGLPPVRLSTGIHSESLLHRPMESNSRLVTTSLEKIIKKATQLQEFSKKVPYTILFSEEVKHSLPPDPLPQIPQFQYLGKSSLRGATDTVDIYGIR